MVFGWRSILAITSSAPAICGTSLGLTKLAASTLATPAAASRSHSSARVSGESVSSSFCRPSRGPTSTISIRTGSPPFPEAPTHNLAPLGRLSSFVRYGNYDPGLRQVSQAASCRYAPRDVLLAKRGSEGGARGGVAAHAVDAASRRRRRGADIETLGGRRVGRDARRWAGEELAKVHQAAVDVAADVVCVDLLQRGRAHRASGQDAVLNAGGETFYLGFYPFGHVEVGAVGNVAVGPDGVLALRGARAVEEALLGEQDEGALGVFAPKDGGLSGGDLIQCPADMNGPGTAAPFCLPGDRTTKREVYLEDARAVAVPCQSAPVTPREVLPRNLQ